MFVIFLDMNQNYLSTSLIGTIILNDPTEFVILIEINFFELARDDKVVYHMRSKTLSKILNPTESVLNPRTHI